MSARSACNDVNSPAIIRLDSEISEKEIDQIVDELAPASERGEKVSVLGSGDLIVQSGVSVDQIKEYENLSVHIHSMATVDPKKHGEVIAANVAVTIQWKNRKCQ